MGKKLREDRELKLLEEEISRILEGDGGGMMNQETKENLITIEGRRNTLLLEREDIWRLKSRAIWLECGDDNTKSFHDYARGRKASNSFWSFMDEHGATQSSFDEKDKIGVAHFENLFKASPQASIVEFIRVAQLVPKFVEEEYNLSLMEEVEEELKVARHSFQKDKSPGPDGWTIEFSIDLYDLLGADILKVVEDSRLSRRILACFNSTFISLNPKVDNPKTLHDFRPISLCN